MVVKEPSSYADEVHVMGSMKLYQLSNLYNIYTQLFYHKKPYEPSFTRLPMAPIVSYGDDKIYSKIYEDEEPGQGRFLRNRGRTPSPEERVMVYDCDKKTLTIQKRREFETGTCPDIFSPPG